MHVKLAPTIHILLISNTLEMSHCMSRITREDTKLPFGDGKHWFYLEEVCGQPTNSQQCDKCQKRTTNVQSSRKFDHGIVGSLYTDISHLFGSPWYLSKVLAYGEPAAT